MDIARSSRGTLLIHYFVTGAIDDLRLPPKTAPARADELWQHTCFETFVRAATNPGYHELNFAPSSQWAAYQFSDYRSGMSDAALAPPTIQSRSSADRYEMRVSLDLGEFSPAPWQLALSAVIEETNGRKSYWALRHPPGKPDFHHPDSFACELT